VILLLPPSETKRDGGAEGSVLELGALSFPELASHRRAAMAALATVSRSVAASTAALGLGATQRFEIDRNRALRSSPVLPALDRYTGVLYDGLGAASLSAAAPEFAREHVVIHSALFGLVAAGDPIPAYRLSHDSRLPTLSLRRHWRSAVAATIERMPGLVLDLRSESYTALGPAPSATYLRVVSEDAGGRKLALSHFNKKGKGEFARAVIEGGVEHDTVESLVAWAAARGIRLEPGSAGELDLVL
jgi:cytoplasmic iron level regulating protein YaaA (DUF328/UPF0246 family)